MQGAFYIRLISMVNFYSTCRNSNQMAFNIANEQANAVPNIHAKYHILTPNKRYSYYFEYIHQLLCHVKHSKPNWYIK